MSSALRTSARSSLPAFAFTFVWRDNQRSWHVRHVAGLVTTALIALLAVWYLGATAYLVFHDQLVASLISHQVDAQYAYEDRIAVLQTQLDRETSRGLLDRQTLTTRMRDLASKSEVLQARAHAIESIVRSLEGKPTQSADTDAYAAAAPSGGGLAGPSVPSPGRSDTLSKDGMHEDHASLTPEQSGAQLFAALDQVEAHQTEQVSLLRGPLLSRVQRLRTALIEAGVPAGHRIFAAKEDVGGPFVPLSDGMRPVSFEQNLSLLRAALTEEARLNRMIDIVPLRRPIESPLRVTSPFGARLDPFLGQAAMHTGMDLVESYGAPAKATADGTVTNAGPEGGYGNMVEIDHGDGIVTRYAHLSAINVVVGQRVSAGAVVGHVGSTGRSTGTHLHYETRINGVPVDPARFLKAGAALFQTRSDTRG